MAKKGGIKKIEASKELDLFIATLIDCLREDGGVKFVGFGKFELKTVKERIGKNPKIGEACIVPEHKKVKFCAGKALAERMKELEDQN